MLESPGLTSQAFRDQKTDGRLSSACALISTQHPRDGTQQVLQKGRDVSWSLWLDGPEAAELERDRVHGCEPGCSRCRLKGSRGLWGGSRLWVFSDP